MVTQNSSSFAEPVGAVFTPLRWAKWLVNEFGLVSKWIAGATVCDPTAGQGVFVRALITAAEEQELEVDAAMLSRLFLIESCGDSLERFRSWFYLHRRKPFPEGNIFCTDVVLNNPRRRFDILVGNPPWVNFSDLPEAYKAMLKPEFIKYKLVDDRQALLLGSARVDLSALVIAITMELNLHQTGEAVFFVPLSLFLNESAHSGFRKTCTLAAERELVEIRDFRESQVFPEISVRFGAVHFKRGSATSFPIPYKIESNGGWLSRLAAPVGELSSPLSIFESTNELEEVTPKLVIELREEQKPRQGVNTCGANDVFVFDELPTELPNEFLFPLITKESFRGSQTPKKYILLPYEARTGRVLDEAALLKYPMLHNYFVTNKESLVRRKGVMLNASIKRGAWWACLGVGPYSFAPFKVVWEAYGKKEFKPQVFSSVDGKPWQGNQAMHAFIPCSSLIEAEDFCERLAASNIERYLKSLNAEGTCNWAQPGRIKRFLKFTRDEKTQTREFQFS